MLDVVAHVFEAICLVLNCGPGVIKDGKEMQKDDEVEVCHGAVTSSSSDWVDIWTEFQRGGCSVESGVGFGS